jgi:lysine 2,3-aminomutase
MHHGGDIRPNYAKVLNDIGVVNYYTFSVKGYMENSEKFATNARAAQEQMEEKIFGQVPPEFQKNLNHIPGSAQDASALIDEVRKEADFPFLATDRNVLESAGSRQKHDLPGIGITRHGRRILEFDHDPTRSHSPIIKKLGKFIIAESKSVASYMDQLEEMGEKKRIPILMGIQHW